jgi:hypothetical protein
MGSKSDATITEGVGLDVETFLTTAGDHQQRVRKSQASAVTTNSWTVATAASTSQIAADVNRVAVLMVNRSTGKVWLRFDSTAPTSTVYHWVLEPGDRYEVPFELTTLAVSMLGELANGTVISLLGTDA